MYRNLVPLKQTDHGNLRFLPVTDYGFARGELIAPIVINEIANVAREYPIVFPKGSNIPAALMGIEKDANAYVGADGSWLATYVPAYLRQYPLAVTRLPAQAAQVDEGTQEDGRFVVLIDEGSAVLSNSEGLPLFAEDGKLAPAGEQRVRLIERMRARAAVTQRLVQEIDSAGLLVERTIRIKREDGGDKQVTGIRVIDDVALNKLEDASFGALRNSGALLLVYASLLSWINFQQGPIGKSREVPTATTALGDDLVEGS